MNNSDDIDDDSEEPAEVVPKKGRGRAKGEAPWGLRKHSGGKPGRKAPSKLLREYRKVWENRLEPDEKKMPKFKALQSLMNDDPKGFLTRMEGLETKREAGVKSEEKQSGVKSDMPDANAIITIKMIEELLTEISKC